MVETSAWDVAEHIANDADAIAYLNAVLELDDPALLQKALGDVARARGMAKVADEVGVSRESLYRSLGCSGNPYFQTVFRVLKSLGMRFTIVSDGGSSAGGRALEA